MQSKRFSGQQVWCHLSGNFIPRRAAGLENVSGWALNAPSASVVMLRLSLSISRSSRTSSQSRSVNRRIKPERPPGKVME